MHIIRSNNVRLAEALRTLRRGRPNVSFYSRADGVLEIEAPKEDEEILRGILNECRTEEREN